MELKLYLKEKKTMKIDGNAVADSAYTTLSNGGVVITVELEAGEHTIIRGGGQPCLYLATLTPEN